MGMRSRDRDTTIDVPTSSDRATQGRVVVDGSRRRQRMFTDFDEHRIATTGAEIFARSGGTGPPLVLLHGYPQTHALWHRVAPPLAEQFTVVAAALPGYGRS
ncbi:MAG: Pimeloyl-ACP methyl ester carboxylesterase, partial [Chloroflexi bacterium]